MYYLVQISDDSSLEMIILNPNSAILSPGSAYAEFIITYHISVISAALGLAKCLITPAPGGTLDGLFSGTFLLGYLASLMGLGVKGTCFVFTVALVSHIIISRIVGIF